MAPGFKSIKSNYEIKGKDLTTVVEIDLEDDLKVRRRARASLADGFRPGVVDSWVPNGHT
jgi:hypothetical protein